MNEEPARKSHAMLWVVCAMAVAPLYLLSVPWVEITAFNHPEYLQPAASAYGRPWSWILAHTPLCGPLVDYSQWCWKFAGITVYE